MQIGNIIRTKLGKSLPFDLEPGRRSFATACPMCSLSRDKSHARSLMVYRDSDAKIRYRCHHAGQCEWNAWQIADDPNPQEVADLPDPVAVMPIPADVEIPMEYLGDKLFWYRDLEGRPLFANRRIEFSTGKAYVPFIYTAEGFITGKEAKWPAGYKGLYGAQTIPGKTKAIIVEGEKAADAAAIRFPNYAVVSWHGGANSIAKADFTLLKDIEAVLLWPDNDEAGKQVMRKISLQLPCAQIKIAKVSHLPAGADLADDLSPEQIRDAVSGAVEMSTAVAGVWNLSDIRAQMSTLAKSRNSGYELIDSHTKLPGSGLVVIEGRTKHGKSALAVALTSAMLLKGSESRVLYYSYEMTAAKVFMRYVKTLDPSADIEHVDHSPAYEQIAELIESRKLQIVDQSAQLNIGDIVLASSKPQVRNGIIIIDYLQIVPLAHNYMPRSRQIMLKEMLDELRVAAHANNVLVLVLSQLTPDYLNPSNDAPREAKDIHYSADMVLRVWNKSVGEHHAAYEKINGNYIIHTYLNRDGESNVRYEGSLEAGSKLTLKRRIRE